MQRIPSSLSQKLSALHNCRYFGSASEEILSELVPGMSLRRYATGETIFTEGDPCLGLHIIESGRVKLYKLSPRGREMILRTLGDGESFNEVPVFDGGENPVNVTALIESEIWVVHRDTIRNAMKKHPEMAADIILNLSQNLRMLVGLVEEISFLQVTNRLARLIYSLPEEQLQGKGSARLTQDDLAARLGTVREVVARSLKELEYSGAIQVARRKILVIDKPLLREWARLPK
jgi:CRP/FNR family transcriptional regulator